MKDVHLCACGIAAIDCEYHRPVYEWTSAEWTSEDGEKIKLHAREAERLGVPVARLGDKVTVTMGAPAPISGTIYPLPADTMLMESVNIWVKTKIGPEAKVTAFLESLEAFGLITTGTKKVGT